MMDMSSPPGAVSSPDLTAPGNLEILAHTAASQASDLHGAGENPSFAGFPVFKLSEASPHGLPLLYPHIKIEGQPGGPMLSQAQIQKIIGGSDLKGENEKRASPLSIIPTTFSDPGQTSPAAPSQASQILHYGPSNVAGDAMLSAINYNENEILQDGFDVTGNLGNLDDGLLGGMSSQRLTENTSGHSFDLFDSEGDSLNMETFSPIMTDSGGLGTVNTITEATESSSSADLSSKDEKKKQKSKGKSPKGQGHLSPGKQGAMECNQCQKLFNNSSALAKHKLTHSEERKFPCVICEKKFKRQDHLNGHLMTHRDKKPYQCTVSGCTKSYCDARSLRRHLENHHQHTAEQITTEMIKAQSTAAEVLADVASTTLVPQSSAINQKSSTESSSAKSVKPETTTGTKPNLNTHIHTLVTKPQYVPVQVASSGVVTGTKVTSSLPQQSQVLSYEVLVQQKHLKEQQQKQKQEIQKQQEMQQWRHEIQQQDQRQKQERDQQTKFVNEEIKAAVQAKQQREQQQQQQFISSSSPKSNWQDLRQQVINSHGSRPGSHPGSGLQSPSSGEQSPGYTAISPGYTAVSPAAGGGQQPQSPIRSPAQLLYSAPQGTNLAQPSGNHSNPVAGENLSEDAVKPIACNICMKRFKTLPALNGHMRLHGGYNINKKDSSQKEDKKKKEKVGMIQPVTNPGKVVVTAGYVLRAAEAVGQLPRGGDNPGAGETQFRKPIQSPPVQQDRDAQAQMNLQLIQQYQQQIQLRQEQLEEQKQQELQIQQQIQQQLQQQIDNGNLDLQQIVQLQIVQQQQQQQQEQQQKLQQSDVQQLQQLHLQHQLQQKQQLEQQQQQQQARLQLEQVPMSSPSPQVPSSPHIARSPHAAQAHILQRQSSVDSVQSPLQSPVHAPPPYQSLGPSAGQEVQHEIMGLPNRENSEFIRHIQNQLQFQNSSANVLHSEIGQMTFNPSVSSHHDNSVTIGQEAFLGQHDQMALVTSANNQNDIHTLDNITEVIKAMEGEDQERREAQSVQSVQQTDNMQDMNRFNNVSMKNSIAQFSGKPYSHSVQESFHNILPDAISQANSQSIDSSHFKQKEEFTRHISSKPSNIRAAQQRQSSFQNTLIAENNGNLESLHNHSSNVPYSSMSPIRESADVYSPMSPIQKKNMEIKRRLSAGPEDFMNNRSSLNNFTSSVINKESVSGTYIKPIQNGANRPRMRSKSGEDHKLLRWRSEDHSFMKPKVKLEETSHRPRSKTDEHLNKWNNKDILSRSDGAGVFRNPTNFPSSFKIKRKNRPAPLIIPPHQNHCGFQSRLRSPRVWFESADVNHSNTVPYTPPPMLSPVRQGSGLFWSLHGSFPASAPITPRSATSSLIRSSSIGKTEEPVKVEPSDGQEPPPESDVLPHVNIGDQYQAMLPEFNPAKSMAKYSESKEDLLWDPAMMAEVPDQDVQMYQEFACSAAVKANGANVEHALHLLHLAKGNIQNAMLMLMTGSVTLPKSHPLIDYKYQESETWSSEDVENYTQAIFKHDKDFFSVANEMKTKSVKQCIQFYYLWKKVLPDEHKRLRMMRRKREQLYNLRSRQQSEPRTAEGGVPVPAVTTEAVVKVEQEVLAEADESDSDTSNSGTVEDQTTEKEEEEELTEAAIFDSPTPSSIPSPVTIPTIPAFACDYPECNSSFSSKPALNAHLKIHIHSSRQVGRVSPSEISSKGPGRPSKPPATAAKPREEQQEGVFPCKLCGRVFSKVKSRSAHMKIHRPDQDKEKEKKAKAANRALLAQKPLQIDPLAYEPALPNGPLN